MDIKTSGNKTVFIIAHKYFRGYQSYIEYYIKNIKSFYENSLVIVVDNNSEHKEDIFENLKKYEDVILLDNDIESKFEIGAYTVGLKYLIDNNIDFEYAVLTQDNFVMKNRYDFGYLLSNQIMACPVVGCYQGPDDGSFYMEVTKGVLERLGLFDNMDKISFVWCSTFVTHRSKIEDLYGYLRQITITNRFESAAGERFLARIIYELSNGINHSLDCELGDVRHRYECHSVDLYSNINSYFAKKVQGKNENTKDRNG